MTDNAMSGEHLDDEQISALVDDGGAPGALHAASCAGCGVRLAAMRRAAALVAAPVTAPGGEERERIIASALAAARSGTGRAGTGGAAGAGEDTEEPYAAVVSLPGRRRRHRPARRATAALSGVAALGALVALVVTQLSGGGPGLSGGPAATPAPMGSHPHDLAPSSLTIDAASPLQFRPLLAETAAPCRTPSSEASSPGAGQAADFPDARAKAGASPGGVAGCVTVGPPILSLTAPPSRRSASTSGGSTGYLSIPSSEAIRLDTYGADHPGTSVAVVGGSRVLAVVDMSRLPRRTSALPTVQVVVITGLTQGTAAALVAAS